MLAGDPDEALEHAEQLLKERSLSSYYDEVALKGLQLAANDAARDVLAPAQIERIKEAIKGLVHDLGSVPDAEPPKEEEETDPVGAPIAEKALPKEPPVEAAATMLAQLLRKHGLGARVVPHEAVSRSNIIGLDTKGVAMVCVSYLEIKGNPAHLRYLLRRLRQKVGDAPILVGLWPAEEAVLTDESLRAAIGADYYVTSLREALKACLEAARAAAQKAAEAEEAKRPAKVAAE